jgi:hypothetical protein
MMIFILIQVEMWCLPKHITKKEAIAAKKLANIALGNFSQKVFEE